VSIGERKRDHLVTAPYELDKLDNLSDLTMSQLVEAITSIVIKTMKEQKDLLSEFQGEPIGQDEIDGETTITTETIARRDLGGITDTGNPPSVPEGESSTPKPKMKRIKGGQRTEDNSPPVHPDLKGDDHSIDHVSETITGPREDSNRGQLIEAELDGKKVKIIGDKPKEPDQFFKAVHQVMDEFSKMYEINGNQTTNGVDSDDKGNTREDGLQRRYGDQGDNPEDDDGDYKETSLDSTTTEIPIATTTSLPVQSDDPSIGDKVDGEHHDPDESEEQPEIAKKDEMDLYLCLNKTRNWSDCAD
jgi:hypothetical protein